MKKVIGIIAILVIVVGLLFVLTGCGNKNETKNTDNKPSQSENQKENNNSGNEWKDINENNYAGILKDKTGIDLSKLGSFTVTDAYGAYTQVAEITGDYGSGTTKVSMFENFIKELLRVSNNSIWTTDVNNDTYRIEKVKEYTTYESFLEWKKNGNEELEEKISGGVYIDNYSINYTFTDKQFNVHIAHYVIK